MNESHRDGNGRDSSAFSTKERRILTGAQVAWRVIVALVVGTAFVLTFYFGIVARQASAEVRLTQHDVAIEKLDNDKQSKESADGNQRLILEQLKAMSDSVKDLRDDVKELRQHVDRKR